MLDAENSRSCWQIIDSNCKKNGTFSIWTLHPPKKISVMLNNYM